ncbi:MAG: hypothetical protein S4CHLAM123_14900 [Chlamydiales bacterium]|nr:hypothetical protein [Chlamydiales bacterium]
MSLLRIRGRQLNKVIQSGGASAKTKRMYKKCHTEMIRRCSFGLATFTFTLLGVAFGMEISRNRTKRGLFMVLGLAALSLISFFVGKEFDHLIWIASFLFLFPHLLIIIASTWTLRRVSRGIE